MPGSPRAARVTGAGVGLGVREYGVGEPGGPHLVLVHGYPDSQDVWDRVVDRLPLRDLHVVTYDVRGAGGSDAPESVDGYRTALLREDLLAVVAATVPGREPFHLVGHDWGSVQLWDVLAAEPADPRLTGRIASFTSISGPWLDHVARLVADSRGRRLRLLGQAVRSSYVWAFRVPVLPELVWSAAGPLLAAVPNHWGRSLTRDARNGLNLYRANRPRRVRSAPDARTDIPVQVIHPTGDRFLTEVLLEDLDQECGDLSVVRLPAGHWVIRSHPDAVARLVAGHLRRAEMLRAT